MEEGELEQQVVSVGRGISFLKQEHLAMLTGLQLEITHLKRRCHGQPPPRSAPPLHPPQPRASLVVAELSCELDSRFPDRNMGGRTNSSYRLCGAPPGGGLWYQPLTPPRSNEQKVKLSFLLFISFWTIGKPACVRLFTCFCLCPFTTTRGGG